MTSKTQKIINVKKLKKKGMYEVTFATFDIKVTEDLIVKYTLVPGKELDEDIIKEIKQEETKEEMFLKVLNYISYQARSEMEIRVYLNKHECNSNDKEIIIDRLKKLDFIDDYHLSELILDNCISNKKGPNKYKEKLYTKGIKEYKEYSLANKLISDGFSPNIVYKEVNKVNFIDNSSELIDKDIDKLIRKYNKLTGKELKNKLITGLLSRGYEYRLITSKLNDIEL